jgi:DNA-directed RNA polymerase sigma subunit (sigma70/sigma32)
MPVDHLPAVTLDTFGEGELNELEPRAAHILRMRSGMWDGEKHTFREIGEELGIRGERVRQIQQEGLALILKLREVQRHRLRMPARHRPGYPWRALK